MTHTSHLTPEETTAVRDRCDNTCGLDKNKLGEFTLGFYHKPKENPSRARYFQFKRSSAKGIRQLAKELGFSTIDRIRE